MAAQQLTIPPTCPRCGQPVEPDQPRRVVGMDLSRWPAEGPANIVGHRTCAMGQEQLITIPPGGRHVNAH